MGAGLRCPGNRTEYLTRIYYMFCFIGWGSKSGDSRVGRILQRED